MAKLKRPPTIGECVGGCCDGVLLDPPDVDEPDDWPDFFELECKTTGARDRYERRIGKDGVQLLPQSLNGVRMVYFDVVGR